MLRMLILRYDSSTDLDAIAQDAGYPKRMLSACGLKQGAISATCVKERPIAPLSIASKA